MYSKGFKRHAVEKALARPEQVSLRKVASSLNIAYSTLGKWVYEHKEQSQHLPLDLVPGGNKMSGEKRPQDWLPQEKLALVIACASLDETQLNEKCRKSGVYPHHLDQWRRELDEAMLNAEKAKLHPECKKLVHENNSLKKELKRKDKALAEAAALLVLQKKVNALWEHDEDD